MEVAALFETMSRRAKVLAAELKSLKESIGVVHDKVLDLIENEKLSHSFKMPSGTGIHVQSQLWASAKDHAALTRVLNDLGLTEYTPKTVNSHSLSAYVREFLDSDGELVIQSAEHPEGIPQKLVDQLKISTVSQVKPTGL